MEKKTILVTGGAGFIGSHLCEWLTKDGHRVISLDNYFTGTKENHVPGVDYREGHTKDIAKHIPENIDLIYHLGEYSRVEQSVLEPEIVYGLNTEGTQGVLDFWKKNKCKLVYAGSSTKFGDNGIGRDASPYARTKAKNSELVTKIGKREYLPYAVTYFYNVYGPRERSGVYGTVVEHFKRMHLSGAPCAIVSPGTQRRNFTHVDDIVEALVAVGEKGEGDEFGLGYEKAYSIFEVAEMFGFGTNIVMFPERSGNRMSARLDTSKANALGWRATRNLRDYISEFVRTHKRGSELEKRVLVFSTTMHPTAGLAEHAFAELAHLIPDVTFDVITTKFTKDAKHAPSPSPNVILHRVGFGSFIDKFTLPLLGVVRGWKISRKRKYLFSWALMASYGAFAGMIYKSSVGMPFLITLADQNIDDFSAIKKFLFSLILSRADQVYGSHGRQEQEAMRASSTILPRNTLGEGDAFANALRYAYADIVRQKIKQQ